MFETLAPRHLEMLRQWRNNPRNRSAMEFSKEISAKQQTAWFAGLNQHENLMLIYFHEGIPQGFVQLKNIDFLAKSAEAGIIHGNEASLNTSIPVIAILVLMELAFDVVSLKHLRAKIQKGNTNVEKLKLALGYQPISAQPQDQFPYYHASVSEFDISTQKFRTALAHQYGNACSIMPNETEKPDFLFQYWSSKISGEQSFQFLSELTIKTTF